MWVNPDYCILWATKETDKDMKLNRFKKYWPIAVLLLLSVIVMTLWLVGMKFQGNKNNFAAETAKPIEQSLLSAGAKRACEKGDGGYGSDNQIPWYEGYFTIAKSEADAIKIMQNATSTAGYTLAHASPENRGPLQVDDMYIEKWFYDYSKQSANSQLEDGNIELWATVNADGTDAVCAGKKMPIDDTHSVMSVGVRLPEFKR